MTTIKFEGRFSGISNKGLRAKIRKAVASENSNPARRAAVLRLANDVALSAVGRATLELVARDYDPIVD